MIKVSISVPVVRKSVLVHFSAAMGREAPRAVLLGASGEQLRSFSLVEEDNELSLDGFEAGAYTLRVEAGNEVMVKQIIIPIV